MITQLESPCWVARWRALGPNPFGEPHFPDEQSAGLEIIRMLKHNTNASVVSLPLPVTCWEIRCDTCPRSLAANEFPEALEFDIHAGTQGEAVAYAVEAGWLVRSDGSCFCSSCRQGDGKSQVPRPRLRSVSQGVRS